MIGPIVVTINDNPLFGPGNATWPNPMNNNMNRGPMSRAGLNEACESGAMNMISRPIVAPTIKGKNHADGALTCLVSSRERITSNRTAVPSTSPARPSINGIVVNPPAAAPAIPGFGEYVVNEAAKPVLSGDPITMPLLAAKSKKLRPKSP